ncbi:cytochrome b/b6 domain-containing protein [uncultured Roseibium sp.]|uniref:cytochrome b n=1 Tax=uncultured Roseibium sp. TaxID=1936171 RepID=UPI00262A5295|nr:cytochrome b/b6 domain-containing protein [uncultured Roseibium sp.]
MKSTPEKYGSVAVTIHWLSAVVILLLLGTGFRATAPTDTLSKEAILTIHASLGMAILLLTSARLLWWVFADRKPVAVTGSPAWQNLTAKFVHGLFYIVVFGMAASGIGMLVLSGASAILFGGANAPLADFSDFAPRIPHGIGARVMIVLLLFHIGGALFHQFIKKDGSFARMWYGGQ